MAQADGDILISLIGLEERVLGAFEKPNQIEAKTYVMFINREFSNDMRVVGYRDKIAESYLKNKDVHFLASSYFDGLEIVRQFNKFTSTELGSLAGKKVLLDASTFNRQNLLVLLRLLRKTHGVTNVHLIYTTPERYNDRLSQGLGGYVNVPFFSGRQPANRKKLLVLLMGYEEERALAIWEREEPNATVIVEGNKPTARDFLQTNRDKIAILQSAFGQCSLDKASANDPHEAKRDLLRIVGAYVEEYNIVAAPLNTKLQAVGLYLAWESYPQIRIAQALPAQFADWLSEGTRETLVFALGEGENQELGGG